jgi:hypothetical protein
MAEYMSFNARFLSWRDFHLARKKGTDGFHKKPIDNDLLLFPGANSGIRNDLLRFMEVVDSLEGEGFLLLPTGGNLVSIIHNCFTLDEGELTSVFGILGSRISSPFKRVNIGER